jgi:hypothetical protein
MTANAERLLAVLPHHGRHSLTRVGHDAGLPSIMVAAAASELADAGLVELSGRFRPLIERRPDAR